MGLGSHYHRGSKCLVWDEFDDFVIIEGHVCICTYLIITRGFYYVFVGILHMFESTVTFAPFKEKGMLLLSQ